jgi:hypothetical protein
MVVCRCCNHCGRLRLNLVRAWQSSREWLETASSYGALEDEFDPEDFGDAVRARPWFQKFLQPEEMLDESALA